MLLKDPPSNSHGGVEQLEKVFVAIQSDQPNPPPLQNEWFNPGAKTTKWSNQVSGSIKQPSAVTNKSPQ